MPHDVDVATVFHKFIKALWQARLARL
jgi:hypothetical protein